MNRTHRGTLVLAFTCATLATACSSSATPSPDDVAASDAGTDVPLEGVDPGPGTPDTPQDGTPDAPADIPADVSTDVPLMDQGSDPGTDPGVAPTPYGAACTADAGCADYFCVTTDLHPAFVGGYCSYSCDPADDASCGAGAACFDADMGMPLCVKLCATDLDCRPPQTVCAGSCVPGSFVASPTPAVTPAVPIPSIQAFLDTFDPDRLMRQLRRLSGADSLSDEGTALFLDSRAVGSPSHVVAVAWLKARLGEATADVVEQAFTGDDGNTYVNLVATIPGSDTTAATVLLSAHYDSTGMSSTGWDAATGIAPGSNDNASGVSIALEALAMLATPGAPQPVRTIRVILFDGEELGLVGSTRYVSDLDTIADPQACVLNVDMVGGAMPAMNGRFWVQWRPGSEAFAAAGAWAMQQFAPQSHPVITDFDTGGGSDAQPFWDAGQCAVGMFAWPRQVTNHTVGDTIATIQPAFLASSARAALAILAVWAWSPDPVQ